MRKHWFKNWLKSLKYQIMRLQCRDALQRIKLRCISKLVQPKVEVVAFQSCNWFGLAFVIMATIFFLNACYRNIPADKTTTPRNTFEENTADDTGKLQIKNAPVTMACQLPNLDPLDKSVASFIEPPPAIECSTKYPKLFRTNFKNKLIQARGFKGTCCYKTLDRKYGDDTMMIYSKGCYRISRKVTNIPSSHEFIHVFCKIHHSKTWTNSQGNSTENTSTKPSEVPSNFTDMFAFVPDKPLTSSIFYKTKTAPCHAHMLNVIVLGLDGQSHMNFLRQMPLTYAFLTKNLSAIEMNGYTKVGDNTFPNIIPILTGKTVEEFKTSCWKSRNSYFDACPFIWKDFKTAGYHTSLGEDAVWMGMFHYEKLGFSRQPTDYYLSPFTLQMSAKVGHTVWGNAKLCYGPRLSFEVLLDYIVKTLVRFQDQQRVFQFIWANSLFHDYLNHPKLGDELLFHTLQWLSNGGYLNNTLLILTSDHGIRWSSIRITYQGRLEERLPMLYFVFPEWFARKYSTAIRNLEINRERLTTPFDIYETLKSLLDLETLTQSPQHTQLKLHRGLSLFHEIPKSRTCNLAGIDDHWCVCHVMKPIRKTLAIVRSAAKFIVTKINRMLELGFSYRAEKNPCAKLRLSKIVNVMKKVDTNLTSLNENFSNHFSSQKGERQMASEDLTGSSECPGRRRTSSIPQLIELRLTIVLEPSEGIFEATVYKIVDRRGLSNEQEWKISGEISRLNLYGQQSPLCTHDVILQKFCYCESGGNINKKVDSPTPTAASTNTVVIVNKSSDVAGHFSDESF